MTTTVLTELLHKQYPLWLMLSACCFIVLVAWLIVLDHRRRRAADAASMSARAHLEVISLRSDYEHVLDSLQRLERENDRLAERLELVQQRKVEVDVLLAQNQARWQEKEAAYAAQLTLLDTAKSGLAKEFENLANRLFEDKHQQFSQLSKAQIEDVIDPFHRQLREFHQRVDDFHRQDIAHRHQLIGQISELQKQSQQIGLDAVNLANALKGGNKAQGCWGELVLDRVLEQAGLMKGREFATQVSYLDAEGKRLQPDAVVYLPDDKQIVVDAKASLVAFERYANAEHEQERAVALREHVDSVRGHIKNLASKRYAELAEVNTLDFVCMFIPIEGAFIAIAQNAPNVIQEAYEHKIILVSPSSLLLVLKTVDSLWQRERQDRNVELIVSEAGKLYDQFVRFVDAMDEVGSSLDKAKGAHARAFSRLSRGRGNLVKRAEHLKQLGAKAARKLPVRLLEGAADEDDETDKEMQLQ